MLSGRSTSCGCKGWKEGFVGTRYGRLVVKKILGKKGKHYQIEAKCDCGKIWKGPANALRGSGNPTRSCGCLLSDTARERLQIDLKGKKFGRLTAIERVKIDGKVKWYCKCSCGGMQSKGTGETYVLTSYLTSLHTVSCGCLARGGVGEEITRRVFESLFNDKFPLKKPKWLRGINGYQMELDGFNEKLKLAFGIKGDSILNLMNIIMSLRKISIINNYETNIKENYVQREIYL